jgi:hypothetical protein
MRVKPAAPGPAPGKATGGGTVRACGVAHFAFKIQRKVRRGTLSGNLNYSDPGANIRLKATSFTSFGGTSNTATFEGACTVNGESCKFSVYIEDNGEPGTNDVFRISINGGPFQGGTLLSGNIKIK